MSGKQRLGVLDSAILKGFANSAILVGPLVRFCNRELPLYTDILFKIWLSFITVPNQRPEGFHMQLYL